MVISRGRISIARGKVFRHDEGGKRMDKNRILIMTGSGKGKTTSAFGMALRVWGHGGRVSVIQSIKHESGSGEVEALRSLPGCEVVCTGLGFTPRRNDETAWREHESAAQQGWELACDKLRDMSVRLVVLDEVFYPIRYGWLTEERVEPILRRFANEEAERILIMTGRNAPEWCINLADTVSSIQEIKHALRQGIVAQEGVEY